MVLGVVQSCPPNEVERVNLSKRLSGVEARRRRLPQMAVMGKLTDSLKALATCEADERGLQGVGTQLREERRTLAT